MPALIHLDATDVRGELEPTGLRDGADSGDPQTSMLPIFPADRDRAGIWECKPGGWQVVNRPTSEAFYVIAGRAKITDDATGKIVEIGPGDFVVVPKGWCGRWDVVETVRKAYTNY